MKMHFEMNHDDLKEAIKGLDIFAKNWCMNCAETEKRNDLVFRCRECEFEEHQTGRCYLKMFAHNHGTKEDLKNFGSMR